MRFLKNIVIALLLGACASGQAAAKTEERVKTLVANYQKALREGNREQVKKLVTGEYYQKLTENKLLERLFKQNSPPSKEQKIKEEYEVEVVESKVVKGSIMASVKEKGSSDKHKEWFKIKKTGDKYLIERDVHTD